MGYKEEKKECQNCKNDFMIEPEDFLFYEKIKVPPPTFCPECRLQRRVSWYNLSNLFHRNCDLCGEQFVSMYPPEAQYIVYCSVCWWSDKWDFRDFEVEYDFSKSFFQQFNELVHKTPMLGLSINSPTCIDSPYNNHAGHLKDSFFTFEADYNQECAYGYLLSHSREIFNSSIVLSSDLVYDCMNSFKSNRVVGTTGNIRSCIDCYFVRDCENCQDCFICANLKNKKYCFKNKQYSKKEYENILESYNLSSYIGYKKTKNDANEFWKTIPPKPVWDTMSVNSTGSYIFNSKNCKECYDVTDAEDSRYLMVIKDKTTKNCYDIFSWGYFLENSYECLAAGEHASSILFGVTCCINSSNIEYSYLAINGNNQLGCVSARKGEYCILNKQYSKKEYKELREKIIKHMYEMPYVDKSGNIFKYGEFFPIELSPFPYNITFAQLFNPKTKDEIEKIGGYFLEDNKNEYKITLEVKNIPDNIKNVEDTILNQVIGCEKCGRGYKIIEMELRFLRKMNLPTPHDCPFCRINEKLNLWVDNMHLKERICDKCGVEFKTHWGKERAPVIYCKKCYQNEVY